MPPSFEQTSVNRNLAGFYQYDNDYRRLMVDVEATLLLLESDDINHSMAGDEQWAEF